MKLKSIGCWLGEEGTSETDNHLMDSVIDLFDHSSRWDKEAEIISKKIILNSSINHIVGTHSNSLLGEAFLIEAHNVCSSG